MMLATGAIPVPLNVTLCVVTVELSVTVRVADLVPRARGLKVTDIAQLPPAATLVPQVLVCAKSAALVPPKAIELIVRGARPLLDSVTVCEMLVVFTSWLVKTNDGGSSAAFGTVPVPVSAIDCWLAGATTATSTDAVRAPGAVGVKLTVMLQLAPAATVTIGNVVPHVCVKAKSAAFAPEILMLEIVKGAVPVLFDTVTVIGVALVVFIG